jgi:hypothetical protein
MPRKITHFYTSQDAAKAARLEGRSGAGAGGSAAGRLRPYFCTSTGAHLLTTDADLDDERSPLPRRRTDGALVLDETKHTLRLYLVDGGVKVVGRRGGVREKQLRLCVACDAGGGGGGGGGEKTSSCAAAAASASTATTTKILLPVAYRTDARSKLLYILPGAVTSLAGGGVLPEEALAEATSAVAAAAAAVAAAAASSDPNGGRRQLALVSRQQQLRKQKLLPPPSCVLPLRGGGCQASILIFEGGGSKGGREGGTEEQAAARFVGVTPDAFVFISKSKVPSAASDEQAIEAAREALGCRRSQLAMQKGPSLIFANSGGGGGGGGKRKRDGEGGEEEEGKREAPAPAPQCSRLLLVTGVPPLAVFEKLRAACDRKQS